MAKKKRTIRFREEVAEGAARDAPEEIRLPSEKGYTRTRKKSRFQGNAAYSRKLHFGKKAPEKPKASRNRAASAALSARIHAAAASENRDDNVGGKALNRGSEAAEDAGRAINSLAGRVQYARKLKVSKMQRSFSRMACMLRGWRTQQRKRGRQGRLQERIPAMPASIPAGGRSTTSSSSIPLHENPERGQGMQLLRFSTQCLENLRKPERYPRGCRPSEQIFRSLSQNIRGCC